MSDTYEKTYAQSLNEPESFWAKAAEDVHWYKKWDTVLDGSQKPFYRWFTGGMTNSCYNALDLHVENGRADQTALIYDSPVTDTIETFTYRELTRRGRTFCWCSRRSRRSERRSGDYLHADGA